MTDRTELLYSPEKCAAFLIKLCVKGLRKPLHEQRKPSKKFAKLLVLERFNEEGTLHISVLFRRLRFSSTA